MSLETAIRTALTGDSALMALATGGVHQDIAPDTVTGTVVTYTHMAGSDSYSMGGHRIETRRMLVKAIASSAATAESAATRIEAVLSAGFAVTGYHLMLCRRSEYVSYRETDTTSTWWHRGGIYEIQMEAA